MPKTSRRSNVLGVHAAFPGPAAHYETAFRVYRAIVRLPNNYDAAGLPATFTYSLAHLRDELNRWVKDCDANDDDNSSLAFAVARLTHIAMCLADEVLP